MPDPAATRWIVPGFVWLWALALISFSLFGARVARYIGVLRRARPEQRWDRLPRRLWLFAVNVLGQKRLFGETWIGAAHFLIFWSFVFYASSFFWNLLRGMAPILPVPYADEVGPMAFALEAAGVLGLAALAVAALRRYIFTPERLERSRDATLILVLISLVLLSSLAGSGFSALAHPRVWQPVGKAIAGLFASLGADAGHAGAGYLAMWWLHMVTVLGFLAYLPYSKHMHLLASTFGVFFAQLDEGVLPAGTEGASKLEEFTWRELFSGLACAECGRCDRACPAFLSGYPLSPKDLMHEVKLLVRGGGGDGAGLVGAAVKNETIWACVTCAACMERCPVFNEHVPLLVEMRRRLVANGEVDAQLQTALMNLGRYGNSFGQSPRNRTKWVPALGFKPKDARNEAVEYLWLTGDYAAYDPRVQPVTVAAGKVFERAGLNFGILYEAEQNSGNDARRAGEEGLFEVLRDKNLASLEKARFERIVTGDPHTYHALKNEYGRDGAVLHYSELLAQLIASGRLPVSQKLEAVVTYHDGCYLGRYNGVYDPPRRVIEALGARLLEMPRNRATAWCCGAGGGHIWMEDVPGIEERPAERRVREAAATGAAILAVGCPKDMVMFEDASKTAGLEGRLAVRDVMQLAEEATRSNGAN